MLELRKVQTSTQTINVTTRHQESIASANQQDFFIENSYNISMNTLQVYLNGLLQRIDDDYQEIDSTTIRFLRNLSQGDKVTFREIL